MDKGSNLALVTYYCIRRTFNLPLWQDPDAWCDLSKFDLPEEPSADGSVNSSPVQPQTSQQQQQQQEALSSHQAATPGPSVTEYRLDGHTISDLSRSSRGELIPISPSTEFGSSGFGTPPSVLKRQKKRRVALSPVTENSASLSFLDSCNSLTPKSTPVKTLPFSPSQVCEHLCLPWLPYRNISCPARARHRYSLHNRYPLIIALCLVLEASGEQNQSWPCPRGAKALGCGSS